MTTHARIDLTNGNSLTIDRLPKAEELAGGGFVEAADMSGGTVLVNARQIVAVTAIEASGATGGEAAANRRPRAAPQPWDA